MKIRVRIRWRRREIAQPYLFHYSYRHVDRLGTGLGISVLAHVGIIVLLLRIGLPGAQRGMSLAGLEPYSIHPITVVVPRPLLYMPASKLAKNLPSRQAPRRKESARTSGPLRAGAAAGARPGGLHLPPGLELPAAQSKTDIEETVLQPHAAALAAPPTLRNVRLLSWPRRSPEPPPSKWKLRIPGGESSAAPQIDAPPKLEIPNREPVAADMNLARALLQPARPALPAPSSTTSPVRVSGAGTSAARQSQEFLASADSDRVNVLMLSAKQPAKGNTVTVPPGSNVRTGGGGDAAPTSDDERERAGVEHPAKPANERAAAARRDAPGARLTGSGAASRQEMDRLSAPQDIAGHGARPWTAAERPGSLTASTLEKAPGPSPDPAARVSNTEVRTHPIHGAYDVVVIQPSAAEAYGQEWGTLSGKPVFTVYLDVGTRKEWILHYCVPHAEEGTQIEESVVSLNKLDGVQPPYPVKTEVPREMLGSRSKYMLIRGFVNAAGRFRDLRVVSQDVPVQQILECLQRWVFRPALRGGLAVEVETLLAVPPVL